MAFAFFAQAQEPANNLNDDGFVADGYDVTAYFSGKAVAGTKAYVATYNDAKYMFVNQSNLDAFEANPEKFAPKYGGYCAYAVAGNKKYAIDPESYLIQDGELLLFYDGAFADTRKKWQKQGAKELKVKADQYWPSLKDQ